MNPFTTTRVAVLRGGHGSQYDRSLRTGASVLSSLPEQYSGVDVLIDQQGNWHVGGIVKSPEKILGQVDVVFNALHGTFGEDGTVQRILELHGIPHTSAQPFASAIGMHKGMSTTLLSKWGIKTPLSLNLRKDDTNSTTIREIFTTFPHPSIVKPQRSGGSVGVSVVHTPQELTNALEEVFSHDDSAHIQEYIPGREVVGCIIKGFRGEQMYTLPILEVKRPHDQQYYSGEHKQHGEGIEFSLDTLTPLERAETKQTTQLAHRLIGLGPYATVDMIVHPRRGIFLLEVNSQPALEETSPFVHALQSVGSSLSQFVEHVIEHARGKK